MEEIGMWRRYEIGTLPLGTLAALLDVIWDLYEQLHRRPTAAEILARVRGA